MYYRASSFLGLVHMRDGGVVSVPYVGTYFSLSAGLANLMTSFEIRQLVAVCFETLRRTGTALLVLYGRVNQSYRYSTLFTGSLLRCS
jgi:hypothetical protein